MKREELIAYDKWLTAKKWLTGIIVSPEQAADAYLAEQSLPPAEGAEYKPKKKLSAHSFWSWYSRDYKTFMVTSTNEIHFDIEDLWRFMDAYAAQQQPTAEGAEEILPQQFISTEDVKRWFQLLVGKSESVMHEDINKTLALHAQKIADKMVEEQGGRKYWDEFNKQYQGNCIGKTLTQILEAFWYYCNGQKTKTKKLMS